MAKWLNFDNFEEITRKAREHVDRAFKKPFFGWARKPKKNKYGDSIQNTDESSPKPVIESKKPEVKTLVELMPTKEQLYARPFDAAPPPSDPE